MNGIEETAVSASGEFNGFRESLSSRFVVFNVPCDCQILRLISQSLKHTYRLDYSRSRMSINTLTAETLALTTSSTSAANQPSV